MARIPLISDWWQLALAIFGIGGVGFGLIRRWWRRLGAEIDVQAERTMTDGHELVITASSRHGPAHDLDIVRIESRNGVDMTATLLAGPAKLRIPKILNPGETVRVPVILPATLNTQGGGGFAVFLTWRNPNGHIQAPRRYDLARP